MSKHPRRRALVLVNSSSRQGRRGAGSVAARLRAGGLDLVEVNCARVRDVTPCIEAHRDMVDCVILGGGDGTLNAAARGLIATGLPMGVLPLGTANDFARSIGMPFDLDAAARVIVEGHTHNVDIGYVNGHPFLNVASVGLAADLNHSAHNPLRGAAPVRYFPVYVTRQIVSPTSSAIRSAPSRAIPSPTGRPHTLAASREALIPFQKPVTKFS